MKVKILDINDQGKINLSIKRAQEEEKKAAEKEKETVQQPTVVSRPREPEMGELAPPSGDLSFEEKLKKFMQASDSKNADKRRNTERKQHARRR